MPRHPAVCFLGGAFASALFSQTTFFYVMFRPAMWAVDWQPPPSTAAQPAFPLCAGADELHVLWQLQCDAPAAGSPCCWATVAASGAAGSGPPLGSAAASSDAGANHTWAGAVGNATEYDVADLNDDGLLTAVEFSQYHTGPTAARCRLRCCC